MLHKKDLTRQNIGSYIELILQARHQCLLITLVLIICLILSLCASVKYGVSPPRAGFEPVTPSTAYQHFIYLAAWILIQTVIKLYFKHYREKTIELET